MTALQVLVAGAVIVVLVWSFFDPRVGWAIAVLCVPFVVHQITDLSAIRSFYDGYLYQPGWLTALPLILAGSGIAALAASPTFTSRRLRHT